MWYIYIRYIACQNIQDGYLKFSIVVITIVKPKKKDNNHRVQCILKTVIYKLYISIEIIASFK